jgi:hypothetical protein
MSSECKNLRAMSVTNDHHPCHLGSGVLTPPCHPEAAAEFSASPRTPNEEPALSLPKGPMQLACSARAARVTNILRPLIHRDKRRRSTTRRAPSSIRIPSHPHCHPEAVEFSAPPRTPNEGSKQLCVRRHFPRTPEILSIGKPHAPRLKPLTTMVKYFSQNVPFTPSTVI